MKRGTVAALVAGMAALGAGEAQAATRWAGETHGSVHRTNRLASGGSSWDGSFWFRAAKDGSITGEAVVAYRPELDLDGADNALGFIRDYTGAALDLLPTPWIGAVAKVGVSSIVGFGVDFESDTVIRRGRLTGRRANGQITLRFPGKLARVPYTLKLLTVDGEQQISDGTAGLHDPFTGSARVRRGWFAAHTAETSAADGDTAETVGSYWAAHRVS